MNKMKLHAKLIDLGVVEEEDTVVIKETERNSVYVNVVEGICDKVTYIFQNNELVIIEGTIHVGNIEKLKELDLEEFE